MAHCSWLINEFHPSISFGIVAINCCTDNTITLAADDVEPTFEVVACKREVIARFV
jgi:hypothetical protein